MWRHVAVCLLAGVLIVATMIAMVFVTAGVLTPIYPYQTEAAPELPNTYDDSHRDPDDPGTQVVQLTSDTEVRTHAIEVEIQAQTNQIRREKNKTTYSLSKALSSIARAHAKDMAERRYFAHRNPDGEHPWDRAGPHMSECNDLAENIVAIQYNGTVILHGKEYSGTTVHGLATGAVDLWMQSPPHRKTLLTPSYEILGVGVYISTEQKTMWAVTLHCDHKPNRKSPPT